MKLELHPDEVLTDFILSYSEHCLTKAEELSFNELMNVNLQIRKCAVSNKSIRSLIHKLPKVTVSDNFDQKMAAAFSLELEKETIRNNKAMISNKELIS